MIILFCFINNLLHHKLSIRTASNASENNRIMSRIRHVSKLRKSSIRWVFGCQQLSAEQFLDNSFPLLSDTLVIFLQNLLCLAILAVALYIFLAVLLLLLDFVLFIVETKMQLLELLFSQYFFG